MAILAAAGRLPSLLVALPAGVWAHRLPRRPVLIAGDVGCTLVLATIPAAALLGILTLLQLAAVAFLASSLSTVFGSAYRAYLPSLVEPCQLTEGNSKLQVSSYLAQIMGPGLAGFLVQIMTAPVAIAADALSYLAGATFLLLIRKTEPRPEWNRSEGSWWREAREDVAFLVHYPIIGSIMATVGAANFLLSASTTVMVLFMTRQLHLSPAEIGLLSSLSGPSGLVGVLVAPWIGRRVGLGPAIIPPRMIPAIILGGMIYGIGNLALPLAGGRLIEVLAAIAAGQLVMGLSSPSYFINWLTIQQGLTPPALRGRVTATSNLVAGGMSPLGSVLGGVVADAIGLRPLLLGVGLWVTMVFAVLALTPLRRLRTLPVAAPQP